MANGNAATDDGKLQPQQPWGTLTEVGLPCT